MEHMFNTEDSVRDANSREPDSFHGTGRDRLRIPNT